MRGSPAGSRTLDACARPECLERVHDLLGQLWSDVPEVSDIDRMSLETAVAEIAANIVEHSDASVQVDLRLTVEVFDDRVEARFVDNGRLVDLDLDAVSLPDLMAEQGRGLALAQATMDEVRYERRNGRNCWLMVRRRSLEET